MREGAKDTIYVNPQNGKITSVPRHIEVKKFLCPRFVKRTLKYLSRDQQGRRWRRRRNGRMAECLPEHTVGGAEREENF